MRWRVKEKVWKMVERTKKRDSEVGEDEETEQIVESGG